MRTGEDLIAGLFFCSGHNPCHGFFGTLNDFFVVETIPLDVIILLKIHLQKRLHVELILLKI